MTLQQRQESKNLFNKAVEDGKVNLVETKSFGGFEIGQEVIVKNGYDIEVGPFEILGFNDKNKMYLDWDCYWYPISIERIVKVV